MKTKTQIPLITYWILIVFWVVFFLGCSSRSRKEKELLNQWKTEARNLLKQQYLLFWFHGIQGTRINLAESFNDHQELLALPTIQFVIDAMNEAHTAGEAQELRFLKNFLLQNHMEMRIAPLDDSLRALFQFSKIPFKGRTIYLKELPFQLINEPHQATRKTLFTASALLRSRMAILLSHKYQFIEQISRQLGYPNYTEFIAEIFEIHPHDLYRLSDSILTHTEKEYQHLSTELQKWYRLPSKAQVWDIPLLRSGKYFDAMLQPYYLNPQQNLFLRSLGINPKRQTGLKEDFNSNPEKIYYRLLVPVDIPVDIRLSLRPHRHFEDLWQLFYLTGQAEHYLHTEITSWINQQLGSPAMRKVYGYLFAGVWKNPAWLRHAFPLSGEDSLRYQQYIRWYELDQMRFYARTFRLGYTIAQSPALSTDSLTTITLQMFNNALPEFGLDALHAEFDPYLNSAMELEAMIIASLLQHYLIQNYGQNWFENPASGKFLKSLWWRGNEITIQYLLKQIGQSQLSTQYLTSP